MISRKSRKLPSSSVCLFIPSCRYYHKESFVERRFAESMAKQFSWNTKSVTKQIHTKDNDLVDFWKLYNDRIVTPFQAQGGGGGRTRRRKKEREEDRTWIKKKKKEKFFTSFSRLNDTLWEWKSSFFAEPPSIPRVTRQKSSSLQTSVVVHSSTKRSDENTRKFLEDRSFLACV